MRKKINDLWNDYNHLNNINIKIYFKYFLLIRFLSSERNRGQKNESREPKNESIERKSESIE